MKNNTLAPKLDFLPDLTYIISLRNLLHGGKCDATMTNRHNLLDDVLGLCVGLIFGGGYEVKFGVQHIWMRIWKQAVQNHLQHVYERVAFSRG